MIFRSPDRNLILLHKQGAVSDIEAALTLPAVSSSNHQAFSI